jgi:hypothetical protein
LARCLGRSNCNQEKGKKTTNQGLPESAQHEKVLLMDGLAETKRERKQALPARQCKPMRITVWKW